MGFYKNHSSGFGGGSNFKTYDKLNVSYILLDKFLKVTLVEGNGNHYAYQFLVDGLEDFLVPYQDDLYRDARKGIEQQYVTALGRARGMISQDPDVQNMFDYKKARFIYRELIALCSRKGLYPEEMENETINLDIGKEEVEGEEVEVEQQEEVGVMDVSELSDE